MAIGKRVGFIGSGQMAEALARGLMEKGMITGDMICCSDPSTARKDLFKSFGKGGTKERRRGSERQGHARAQALGHAAPMRAVPSGARMGGQGRAISTSSTAASSIPTHFS